MDTLTPNQRSECMSRVHGRDTKPEMVVRRLVHRMGYRYRLHQRHLPGVPDLVFSRRKKLIFVHGCFWHWHEHGSCRGPRMPKTRVSYWREKLQSNVERDAENIERLGADGWQVLVVWECELKDMHALEMRLRNFLN